MKMAFEMEGEAPLRCAVPLRVGGEEAPSPRPSHALRVWGDRAGEPCERTWRGQAAWRLGQKVGAHHRHHVAPTSCGGESRRACGQGPRHRPGGPLWGRHPGQRTSRATPGQGTRRLRLGESQSPGACPGARTGTWGKWLCTCFCFFVSFVCFCSWLPGDLPLG